MPKELEERLKQEADKHEDWDQEHKDKYVYGTLQTLKDRRAAKSTGS